MEQGNIATRQQFTGALFIQEIDPATGVADAGGHFNVGDVEGHKWDLTREGSDVLQRANGYHLKIGNLTAVAGMGFEVKLREIFGPIQKWILKGTQGADATQGALVAPNGTFQQVGAKKGRTLVIGKHKLDTVVVKVGATTYVSGTDYDVDLNAGTIYIKPTGSIADASTVDVTFGCAALTFETFTSLDDAGAKRANIVLHEYDQHVKTPRTETTGVAQFWVETGPDHDGKKQAVPVLKAIWVTKPAVRQLK